MMFPSRFKRPLPTNSPNNRKDIEDRISKLLTRLSRQFSAQRPSEQSSAYYQVPPRPPDQAATSLGRELADAFLQSLELDNDLEASRHKVMHSLENRGIHPSIPHAFFEELTSSNNPQQDRYQNCGWEDWLPAFILQCEQRILDELPNSGSSSASALYDEEAANGLNETLAAALRAYAASHAMLVHAHSKNANSHHRRKSDEMLTSTYRRLQTTAGRTILLREFSRATKELHMIPHTLSPLMAASVLSCCGPRPTRKRPSCCKNCGDNAWDVIYATDTFAQFWDISLLDDRSTQLVSVGLAQCQSPSPRTLDRLGGNWRNVGLSNSSDMIAFVVHATTSDEETNGGPLSAERLLAEWLQLVMNKLLPTLATQGAGSYRLSLEPLLEQLNGLIVEMDDSLVQLRTMVVFKPLPPWPWPLLSREKPRAFCRSFPTCCLRNRPTPGP